MIWYVDMHRLNSERSFDAQRCSEDPIKLQLWAFSDIIIITLPCGVNYHHSA